MALETFKKYVEHQKSIGRIDVLTRIKLGLEENLGKKDKPHLKERLDIVNNLLTKDKEPSLSKKEKSKKSK